MMDDVWRWSAARLAATLCRREIAPVEVVDAVLDRIARLNPRLNAFAAATAAAAREAARRTAARLSRRRLGTWRRSPCLIRTAR
jgi:Asp-tRNA(Asn)/Glu-tRNA(Gln) amidotransferase A subunit family amidase